MMLMEEMDYLHSFSLSLSFLFVGSMTKIATHVTLKYTEKTGTACALEKLLS